jgi:chromosome segregation ATPase
LPFEAQPGLGNSQSSLGAMDGTKAVTQPYLRLVSKGFFRVVTTDREEMRPMASDFPWELLLYGAITELFSIILLLWRSFQSLRSRLYVRRETNLATELSGLIEEKCQLLEKVSLVEKQLDAFVSSLREASFEPCSMEAQTLEAACEQLKRSKSKLDEVLLEKQLKAEKSKCSKQVELMKEMSKLIPALEDKSKSLESNVLNAKTTLRILQNTGAHLKDSVRDARKEKAQLQESCKQLSQEAQVWKERVSELTKQKTAVYTQLGEVDKGRLHRAY